jgi:hypothetical protein
MPNTENMPKVELIELKNTFVRVPTQKLYDRLMKIYEAGKWNWENGNLPTDYRFQVCIITHVEAKDNFNHTEQPKYYKNFNSITVNEFCQKENIDELKQQEINKWFRYNKSNRLSLGQRLI